MQHFAEKFARDTEGAVTVDWVVLTAAIVGLAFAVTTVISKGATDPAASVGNVLTDRDVSTQ